jgi:hypothetical protein
MSITRIAWCLTSQGENIIMRKLLASAAILACSALPAMAQSTSGSPDSISMYPTNVWGGMGLHMPSDGNWYWHVFNGDPNDPVDAQMILANSHGCYIYLEASGNYITNLYVPAGC